VVFGPEPERRADGVRLRVYRKVGKRGLVLVEVTNEDRVRSKELGCWLRAVGEGVGPAAAGGAGAAREELLWTEGERAKQERAAREREAARAEQERAAREHAERELARLRAELDAIRR